MKKYLLIFFALMSFTEFNQQPGDRIGIKGPLIFNDIKFNLAWTSKPTENYYIQEYLPAGESVEHFNQMLSIFLLVTDIKTKDAVQKKINELKERRKTDATCNYMVNQSPDKKEYMIDFLLGENKNGKVEVEEFNVYRYKQIALSNNKKAIFVFAYSKRAYGDDIIPFFTDLKTDRATFLNDMIAAEMPPVTIGNDTTIDNN